MNAEQTPENTYRGRIHKAFIRVCPEYTNVEYVDGRFQDEMVQCFYVMFSAGYKAHPSFNHGGVHFIAKETETGLEISEEPAFHINFVRATNEKARLENKHPGTTFHIFSLLANSDPVRDKLRAEFAARNVSRKRKQKPQALPVPRTIKAGKKGVYLQAKDDHRPFVVVEDTLDDAEFIQVIFDELPDERIASPVKIGDCVFAGKSQ